MSVTTRDPHCSRSRARRFAVFYIAPRARAWLTVGGRALSSLSRCRKAIPIHAKTAKDATRCTRENHNTPECARKGFYARCDQKSHARSFAPVTRRILGHEKRNMYIYTERIAARTIKPTTTIYSYIDT